VVAKSEAEEREWGDWRSVGWSLSAGDRKKVEKKKDVGRNGGREEGREK